MSLYALQLRKKRASNSNISQSFELINQTEENRFFQKNEKAYYFKFIYLCKYSLTEQPKIGSNSGLFSICNLEI